jgi:hypothetical protein
MRQFTVPAVAALSIAVLNPALAAPIGANRTFVSGFGSDSNGVNSCNFNQPCRTFATALGVTNPSGEIVVLDPAGYGTVTITKSVSIVNDGVGIASITDTVAGTNAITIAAAAGDVVNLRGLTVTGADTGSGTNGIVFQSGAALNIQNCAVRGFSSTGIEFVPTVSSTLTVVDTIVSDIGGTSAAILLAPSGSGLAVNAYLARVQVSGNGQHGIDANSTNMTGGSLQVMVADSVATSNPNGAGILIPTLSTPIVTVINTRLTNNADGINAGSGVAYIAETTISGNSDAGFIVRPGAVINSFGNNRITDTTNLGTLTAISPE